MAAIAAEKAAQQALAGAVTDGGQIPVLGTLVVSTANESKEKKTKKEK